MVFEINEINNKKLSEFYERAMSELDSFFGLNWKRNRPVLIIVPDRKTIDALMGKKTEEWVIGWSTGRDFYVLSPENYEKESSHKYSDETYFALIKHELAHCFTNAVTSYSKLPTWLAEGVSVYLSGQNKLKTKPEKFKEFIGFYNTMNKGIYAESGFAIEFLVKKQGKKKLISLLKKAGECKSQKEFSLLFKKIYGFELAYKNFQV